ncbi:Ppx/GppA family phosphatase [Yoonia sediminilitoris]|uniref:Exopolyphosphatase/guanosine-5'-triphosphate, 3'-diphosphate pyrophosphatase n=1 Tax=Yoonia sediminilitoris TaxID=1286148 RepID=A0A2T6KQ48_9RHOB|nr:Ppx/GppA family phosphatase [Yoonia sediminilitoris]PUB18679.1 exopolyphosphatase/guanosine-5'-triphosphate,3'-diphosphate pyrophosphatase [Yoonia sediminilitoris]RCW98847.1 exopolyphosphatase/guanosine-5'-triphosphate,3'-diphosphate pyrophosphatase [Yoonia sediminilitoris]
MNQQPETIDWGPFGRPLFEEAAAKGLTRVGVIDVGSNSVRMVVFDGAARSPAYFYNEKIMCALGAGLSETGHLSPEGRVRALSAIRRFAALAEGMGITPLTAVATAAVREASDGEDFREEVLRETGIKIWIIDGNEEARLSAQGVLLGWPGSYGLVCDIGGSSLELADLADGRVGRRLTSALGPLKLREIKGGRKAVKAYVRETMEKLHAEMGHETGMRLFLVGGSWRAIARVDMERRNYPLTVLHEYRMTAHKIAKTAEYIRKSDLEELRGRCNISHSRMSLVPLAVIVLKELIRVFKPKDVAVSSYGIREGMLFEQMPRELRDRDPLVEACRFAEAKDARLPGFGRIMYDFVKPLFPRANWQRKRIIKAACLLHDVSWRAHPDYRAEVTFDNATRANLGGLKHYERVFLGLALMNRYSGKATSGRFEALIGMLNEDQIKEAAVLGKAMRLGAMLWTNIDEPPGTLQWSPKSAQLTLKLTQQARPLFGEVAEARFKALASAMDAEGHVKFTRAPNGKSS